MKKFTLLFALCALFSMTSFAQKGLKMQPFTKVAQQGLNVKGVNRQAQTAVKNTRRSGEELVTPPATATVETWYTTAGKFYLYSSGKYNDFSADMKTIKVAIVGSDIYLQGLAYWFKEGWIKGTISGTTATFANGQYIGEDDGDPGYIVGSNDGKTPSESIVFDYDAEKGTLTAATPYIIESAESGEVAPYCFWSEPAFSKTAPAKPEVVVVPEGVASVPFIMYYSDKQGIEYSKPVNIAVDGNDVYIQGFSEYLPEAWVKGTKDGNKVTFAGDQYMGALDEEESYFFYEKESVVFTYNAEEDSYSFAGEIYGIIADQYYDGHYYYPVLEKVVEKAGTPATPSITGIEQTEYGDVLVFDVPVVDVNGNAMVASKLSYQFFIDEETNPLTFTTTDYKKLTENLTVIPYGFTENYDFYATSIYLNMAHNNWSKIGIQSIYTGGGEEHKSEISWFNIADALPVVAPEDLETEVYTFSAKVIEGNKTEAEDYTYQSAIGFDGNDVYIKGLSENTADMWIKATKNEAGKYVIPANQYIGQLAVWTYKFDYYLAAKDAEGNAVDIVLSFDADKKQFTTDQTVVLNGAVGEWDPYQTFTEVQFSKFVEVAATPAAPSIEGTNFTGSYPLIHCSVPTVGTNGEDLNQDKLFYTIWIEKDGTQVAYTFTAGAYKEDFTEDVTEIPYKHSGYDFYTGGTTIYFEESADELASWTNIGIQSIYYGGGECNKSAVAWYNNGATGISNVKTGNQKAVIYNLNGQRVDNARKGIYIINGRKTVVK